MRLWLGTVALACACGGGPSTPADASGTDALDAADASIDAPWTVGTLKVVARNGLASSGGAHPSPGTAVVFTDATQQTQVVMTDADGIASATVTGPTTITHVQPWTATLDEAMSVIGAMPGDEILLERIGADYTARAPVQVSFTPAAGTSYTACTACKCESATTSPISVPMYEFCQTNPAQVVLLAGSGGITAYGNGTAAYDGTSGGSITLAPSTPITQTYDGLFTGLPPEVANLYFAFRAGSDDRTQVMGPASSETLQVHGWDGLPKLLHANLYRSDGAVQVVSEAVTSSTTSLAVDGSSLLPWLGAPFFDVATMTFHAPSLPGGTVGDVFIGIFTYATTSDKSVVWTVIAAEPGTFVLPSLPASVLNVTPMPGIPPGTATGLVVAADTVDGFAEARRDPLRMWREGGDVQGPRMHFSESAVANPPYFP